MHSSIAGAIGRVVVPFFDRCARLVYCPHGWAFDRDCSFIVKALVRIIEVVLAKRTDKIICVSRHESKIGVAAGLPNEIFRVIPNGISPHVAQNGAPIDFDPTLLNVLFVGRLDRQKGLDLVLQKYHEFSHLPICLHVVGEAVLDKRLELSTSLAKVKFYGWRDRSAVASFIASSDVVLMPSRWEAFGLVALEAMRSSRPVIVSNRGALPEIIRHGSTGLVVDLDDFAKNAFQAIVNLGKQNLQEMGIRGRLEFERQYTSDRMNHQTLELYGQVCRSCL